ncbi:MAG: DMT family transporter [Burkholderiaceae bacterium]|jgi:drug/metabolite transporter (DMT)-like permease|nr:DMT family transporter [Burkholderiaceae bacterium]
MSAALPLSPSRTGALTLLALAAFAGNSLLCRAALRDTAIDAASFTAIRLASGALALWLIVSASARLRTASGAGSWPSALALFGYAIAFSFAYLSLTAATGALLLFGAVQVTMIAVGLARGERLQPLRWAGFVLAFGGLVGLLLPGLSAPPLFGAALMITAGIAWGIYSLRGRGAGDPTRVTAGNFLRAAPLGFAAALLALPWLQIDAAGALYAVASGALTSGVGYAIWYAALKGLRATSAATVQLAVPVVTALAAVLLLAEPITPRLVLASAAVLGGIALVVMTKRA